MRVPPLPIPNREVKPHHADGTASQWELSLIHISSDLLLFRLFLFSVCCFRMGPFLFPSLYARANIIMCVLFSSVSYTHLDVYKRQLLFQGRCDYCITALCHDNGPGLLPYGYPETSVSFGKVRHLSSVRT